MTQIIRPEDGATLGCAGCAILLWCIYTLAFIGFWVLVALALIHYIHGH